MLTAFSHDPADPFMDDVVDFDGVDLRLTSMGEGLVFIDLLEVAPIFRGQGLASKSLKALTDNADAWGVSLMLKAATMSDCFSQHDLECFYARYGFHEIRRCDHGWSTMFRDPVS